MAGDPGRFYPDQNLGFSLEMDGNSHGMPAYHVDAARDPFSGNDVYTTHHGGGTAYWMVGRTLVWGFIEKETDPALAPRTPRRTLHGGAEPQRRETPNREPEP